MNSQKFYLNLMIIFIGIASLTYNTSIHFLRSIGYGSVIVLFCAGLLLFIINKKFNKLTQPSVIVLVYIIFFLYLLGMARNFTFIAIKDLCLFLISMIFFLSFLKIDMRFFNHKLCAFIIGIQLVILYFPLLLHTGFSSIDNGYKSIYSTTTFLGIFSCLMSEIALLCWVRFQNKIWITYVFFWGYLCWVSKVRTALVAMTLLIGLLCFSKIAYQLNLRKKYGYILKWVVISSIFLFIFVYPTIQKTSWFPSLSLFVYVTTGKVLMSGRDIIWKDAFNLIQNKWLLGYGLDYSYLGEISIHNSYLNILLQGGILQLSIIIIFINLLLNYIINYNNDFKLLCLICCLVNLLMCVTETMLFGGQIIIQILIWVIWGISVNKEVGAYK